MDKSAIRKFAVTARVKLMEAVEQKAFELGITKDGVKEADVFEDTFLINQKFYEQHEIKQREQLILQVNQRGYEQVIEEVAYTWFNRFIALRFMEVNDYLPSGMRIFSSIEPKKREPDALSEVMMLIDDLDLDRERVYALQDAHNTEGLFKYILIKQCNQLGEIMPKMFEQIEDYTELLLPSQLLAENAVIDDMITMIAEEDWTTEVEIIGWLYQYYNSEVKEKVGGLKNTSISKEDLPVVTQLFTPKWIVQYMVENSLGKVYDEFNPDNRLSNEWEFYLKSQTPNEQLFPFQNIEDIKVIDPASGSGHILLYVFDLLYDIYTEKGYRKRDIPQLIFENNLYGLDIDKRSTQIANTALWMKALEREPSLLQKKVSLDFKVIEIVDTDFSLSEEAIDFLVASSKEESELRLVQEAFKNGKQFGSLIVPPDIAYSRFIERIEAYNIEEYDLFEQSLIWELKDKLLSILIVGKYLHQKYDVSITNPPYHNKFNPELKKFMQKYYKDTKSDLYSAFIARTVEMTKENGYAALMTPFTWMFISSHEKMRNFVLNGATLSSLVQMEYSAFEEATVPICTFVIQHQQRDTIGDYVRLADFKGADIQPVKLKEAVKNPEVDFRYQTDSGHFSDIPGSPIAYWASDKIRNLFNSNMKIGDIVTGGNGMTTGKNDLFLRLWYEVNTERVSFDSNQEYKWFPYIKGGFYRKWYGNLEYIINWENDGEDIKETGRCFLRNKNNYFSEGISWSKISSGDFSVRYSPEGTLFDVAGISLFNNNTETLKKTLGFLNTKLSNELIKYLSSTINYESGSIKSLPYIEGNNQILSIVEHNISLSKSDWDSFETSWDFQEHPFLEFRQEATKISVAFQHWEKEAENRFKTLKENEEELNRIFIALYGLEDELTPEVEDKDVTVSRADLMRDVKSFLSYAVGVMFGRYSLDKAGLAFAGGDFSINDYETFKPDVENVIPITDEAYFEDDLVNRLITFLQVTFGADDVEENLDFMADALTRRQDETARQRLRRYFLKEFYKDHVKMYQKRPIYWLFDSGKQDGFKALVYLHRYDAGLVSRVRIDYLHQQQKKYEEEMEHLDRLLTAGVSNREQAKARKEKEKLEKQMLECRQYDQVIAHMANQQLELDLDDGVKVNYAKFQNIEIPQGEDKQPLKGNILAGI